MRRRVSSSPPVSTAVYLDTDRGTIQIELAVLDAPLTVENFVTLARKGYFDGLNVHRVVPDFVIQSGDPRGDGEGGPGYTIRDELSERPYLRGTVGMALDLWGDTGGSQFFITHSPQPHLDAKYTVFGRVIAGMDVVDQIQQGDIIRRVRVKDGETTTSRTRNRSKRRAYMEKGAPRRPLFDGRGQLSVSCRPSSSRPWLSLPLSVIPPFIWVYLRERSRHSLLRGPSCSGVTRTPWWLPPGTLTRCRPSSRRGTFHAAQLRKGEAKTFSTSLGMA